MKLQRIRTFYTPAMSLDPGKGASYSMTPSKPGLLMDFLERAGLADHFLIDSGFQPFSAGDFCIAHTREMVDNFFERGQDQQHTEH